MRGSDGLEPESADAVAAAHHDGGVGGCLNAGAVGLHEVQVIFRQLYPNGGALAGREVNGGALRHGGSAVRMRSSVPARP